MESGSSHQRLAAVLEKAEHLREIGRYDLAERTLQEGLMEHPQDADLHLQLAYVYAASDRPQAAVASTQEALRCDPTEGYALLLLGDLARDRGEHVEAERHYLAALQLSPQNARFLAKYGALMFKVGELEKAEKLIRASLQIDPDSSMAHSLLTMILVAQAKGQSAHEAGEQGLRLAPDHEVPHLSLGISYYQRGRPLKARKHLREALRINPGDHNTAETFREFDQSARWIGLPFYYWSWLCEKIPGGPFAIWGLFLISTVAMDRMGVPTNIKAVVILSYAAFAIYTWIATPLTKLWVRWRPAE